MKKGDIIYVKSTVGNLPVCNGYRARVVYVTKVMNEERSARCIVDRRYSFARGLEIEDVKMTFRLNIPAYQIFTDRKEFITSLYDALVNFEKIIDKSKYEINYF